ncbi:pyrimidine reductase family protein [Gordonia pseudamarae]|uniref:Pyrimidine reductase family protein n=1 Tax=Gordonia pseudamarae TaxID=2831662 RepID=A0ABX6IIH6_9ACTN|nr:MULTISPECIES: pyrimidine reductase family protein [Gordonia]MBD0020866.1 pyrimidine reductase family protein [Gordonia sp. (in: high G+C Gram-positive bacteria)]QHN26267.1 pyrimidine reductase family protein [Gordonia pseudamarae]QHN35159.1 pyrimidine reductase family protein [Gordonia pseudamarae]
MFSELKATHITSGSVDDPATLRALADLYPYPPTSSSPPGTGTPWFRVNFVSSIDGAVTRNGKSGDLAGPGDRAVFRVLRALADVVVVGARTALTEGYRQPQPDDVFVAARRRDGQAPAPTLALVSRSLGIPTDYSPLAHPDTVIFTCEAAPADRRRALTDAGATVVSCGEDTVDPELLIRECGERGWGRVLCEGGPSLFGSALAAGVVDELCHTTSPMLVAGGAGRIANGPALASQRSMRPVTVVADDDGFVFTRWVREPAR